MFALKFLDVWCVIGATLIITSWIEKSKITFNYALLASLLFLVPILVGPLRHHIGRGLTEYTAMFFLMLTFWYVFSGRHVDTIKIMVAGLCGVIAYWARQDHLLVIFSNVIVLSIYIRHKI